MWKLILGFVVFAGIALFILTKSGGNIDMSGEKHGAEAPVAAASAVAEPAPASDSAPAASAASH